MWQDVVEMSEQQKEPKKYYEYYYYYHRAERKRRIHERNGRAVCEKPEMHNDSNPMAWRIWYEREEDTLREVTSNAREYDL